MSADSLKVIQNKDKTFTLEWDKNDPNWAWLNGLTEEQIQIIIKQAIQDFSENDETTFVNNLSVFIKNTEERILKLVDLDFFRRKFILA